MPEANELERLVGAIRAKLKKVAARANTPLREFAATLVAVVATPNGGCAVHIGDGAVVWKQAGSWHAASWPEHGEYASTTYFVTDDNLRVRITCTDAPIEAFALFSDGLERLVLDFAMQSPHTPFFERMLAPVRACSRPGRNVELSGQLRRYLSQDAVNSRTDDDKTLVLVTQ